MNDRFYKVFCSTFPEAPKRCVANGFDVLQNRKLLLTFSENLVVFNTFEVRFRKGLQKYQ